MRLVIQRVKSASVHIEGYLFSEIRDGLLVFVGIEDADDHEDLSWLAAKVCQMRIFTDAEGKMNLDLKQVKGDVLLVSQFTLHASVKKGNRPSFIKAARPEKAIPLYESLIEEFEKLLEQKIKTGKFGADMQVSLINDGPVTVTMDSKNRE